MLNTDKMINNILSKNKRTTTKNTLMGKPTGFGRLSLPTFKPIQTNVSMNMLGRTTSKPASLQRQQQWNAFSTPVKNILRTRYPDNDGDRVPNRWDCQPNNSFRQDDVSEKEKRIEIEVEKQLNRIDRIGESMKLDKDMVFDYIDNNYGTEEEDLVTLKNMTDEDIKQALLKFDKTYYK